MNKRVYSFAAVHYLRCDLDNVPDGPLQTTLRLRAVREAAVLKSLSNDRVVREKLLCGKLILRPASVIEVELGSGHRPPLQRAPDGRCEKIRELPFLGFLEDGPLKLSTCERRAAKAGEGKVEYELPPLGFGEMQQVLVRVPVDDPRSAYAVEVEHLHEGKPIGGLFIVFTPEQKLYSTEPAKAS